MSGSPYVVERAEDFAPDALFVQGRDQLVLAVRIAPVPGRLELSLVAAIVDEANARGLALRRESPLGEEYLLLVLEAYEEDDEDEDDEDDDEDD